MQLVASAIGENVRACRRQMGLTIEQLAHRTELAPSTIGNIEVGKKMPSLDSMARLSTALHQPIEHLLGYSQPIIKVDSLALIVLDRARELAQEALNPS